MHIQEIIEKQNADFQEEYIKAKAQEDIQLQKKESMLLFI